MEEPDLVQRQVESSRGHRPSLCGPSAELNHPWGSFYHTGRRVLLCFRVPSMLFRRKAEPCRKRGWRRWQRPCSWAYGSILPFCLIYSSQPARERVRSSSHLQVKAPVLVTLSAQKAPSSTVRPGPHRGQLSVKSKCPEQGQRLIWAGARGSEQIPITPVAAPEPLVPSTGVAEREHPLRQEAGEGMRAVGPRWGASSRPLQPGLSCFPSLLQSLTFPLCFLHPPASRALFQSPRMH